jgi:hypothetical protein
MPKGTDLSVHGAEDLARFAASLNNRPRETLGFMKPSGKLAELVAIDLSASLRKTPGGPSSSHKVASGPTCSGSRGREAASTLMERALGNRNGEPRVVGPTG